MSDEVYRFADFEMRPAERALRRGGEAVALGSRAFDVLATLVERGGALVTKAELLDRAWPGLIVEEANVQVQISGLRKVLGAQAIATIPGIGYRFAARLLAPAAESGPAASTPMARSVDGSGPDPAAHAPATTLVGRDDDIDALCRWVVESRLVTVLGTGGVGKTQVARQVRPRVAERFADGTAWVDLSSLPSRESMLHGIATAARARLPETGSDPLAALAAALAGHRMLLVLDNCEHLAGAVGALVHRVHAAAPGVHVLTTTQEVLSVPGERIYRLDPLGVPPPGTPLERLEDYTAAQMLLRHARAADRRFALGPGSAADVVALLARLDGLPLAIEMAAAWLPKLGARALVARLAEWQGLLRAPSHGVPARQQTLRATLDWSHSLLQPAERAVLHRLSVFAGTFRIDRVHPVAGDTAGDENAVLDVLGSLIDKSLVQPAQFDPPRYRLLETMRVHAAEQLAAEGEAEAACLRHGRAMAELAAEMETRFWGMSDREWLALYAPDYDDLQVAFDRACAAREIETAAVIGAALQRMDHLRSITSERRRRAGPLFAMLPEAGDTARAWIWMCLTSHNMIALDVVPRMEAARQAVAAWRRLEDPMRLHFALGYLANEHARAGDFAAADAALAEADALQRPDWPVRRAAWSASAHAGVCIHKGDAAGYRAACRLELTHTDRIGAERSGATARLKLADAALMAGDLDEAIELGAAAVQQLRSLDQPANLGLALSNLCSALVLAGRRDDATIAGAEALPLLWRAGWGYLLLDAVSLIAAETGQCDEAARLLGYAEAWYRRHDDVRQPNEARLAAAAEAIVGRALGERLVKARKAGAALTDAEAEFLAARVVGGGSANSAAG